MAKVNLNGQMDHLIEETIIRDFVKDLENILIVKIQAFPKEYGRKEL